MKDLEYQNIICEEKHNGQKCSFSKGINTKLKMLLTIGTVSALAIATFSGCANIKKDIEQLIMPETSHVQMMEETTYEDKNAIIEYDELLNQLNIELQKKGFSNEINSLFKDTFEYLYKNYSSWEKGYKDLPSKEAYIKKNLIDIIQNIDNIEFYEGNSEEGKRKLKEGDAFAWTEICEDDSIKIVVIAESAGSDDKKLREYDIERFFHELIHCKGKNIIFDWKYFKKYEEIRQIIIEGAATFNMKFVQPSDSEKLGSWIIENEEESIEISYDKEDCIGYLVEMNAYEKLVYLVGYNVMDKVEKGEEPLSIIEETIAKTYGKKQAKQILETMSDWYLEYEAAWKSNKTFDLSIRLEKEFLEFVKQDINSLETEDQIEKFKKMWKNYKKHNIPQVTNIGETKNITKEVFELEKIDDMLKGKEKNSIRENTGIERE